MSRKIINLGTVDNDHTGDNAKAAGGKINDNFAELYIHGARAKFSADQTLKDFSAGASVQWDAEDFDTDGIHSTVTTPQRMTVPSGFAYARVECGIYIQNVTAALSPIIQIRKNGTAIAATQGYNAGTNWGSTQTSGLVPCVAGDYFDCFMQVSGDTSIDILAARSFLSIQLYA